MTTGIDAQVLLLKQSGPTFNLPDRCFGSKLIGGWGQLNQPTSYVTVLAFRSPVVHHEFNWSFVSYNCEGLANTKVCPLAHCFCHCSCFCLYGSI